MATCDRLWAYVGTGAAGGRVKCGCARAFASRALDIENNIDLNIFSYLQVQKNYLLLKAIRKS